MKIDFSTYIKDSNGDLPANVKTKDGQVVKDDDNRPIQEEVKVEIGDHIVDFLNRAVQDSSDLKTINALRGIMGDIARGKKEYSEDDVKLIKEKIEDQLPLDDEVKKPSIVMTSIAELLDT